MNIHEEEEWVMSRRNKHHGLQPLRDACASIGNPQNQIKVIHVAGTNGKGSTSRAIQQILHMHGYKTGLFTSPHLVDHRDRIRINDDWISEAEFHTYLNRFMKLILAYDLGMFEIDCLIAFAWFYDQKVDYAVIECGLGGRLDSTNVIDNPVLCVITTIAMDHMDVLGNRLEQIANEKAGIMRCTVPTVTGTLRQNASTVIQRHAERIFAPLHVRRPYRSINSHTFIYRNDIYKMTCRAEYQKKNLSLALEACWTLGINIHDELTHQAVQQFNWPGRFEKIRKNPDVIVDGAHNKEGMHALLTSITEVKRPLTIVFSALKDKPGNEMARYYQKEADHLIITHFDNSRADTLADLYVPGAVTEEDWHQAIRKALDMAEDGTVLITGSLYFVSLARAWLTSV